jgi:hypothetical protein
MEIKSFILPIDRQHFLDNLEKFNFEIWDNPPVDFIQFCLNKWFFSHNRKVNVDIDDVDLPEVDEIEGEPIEEEVKRQILELPREVLFNCQVLTKEGKADSIYVSLIDEDINLLKCLKLIAGLSSDSTCLTIYDKNLADFLHDSKDKKQSFKMWVKDYLENEYPRLSFTVGKDEGDPVSSTEAIKEFCCLDETFKKWNWLVWIRKDDKGEWNIVRMTH